MLDKYALYNTSNAVSVDKLSLSLLVEYYEEFLMPYTYVYHLQDGSRINLEFHPDRLCHLLGVEKAVQFSFPENKRGPYRGNAGFENIKHGRITLQHLKSKDHKGQFDRVKPKIQHFHLISKLVESASVMVRHDATTGDVEYTLLIYHVHNHTTYVHLGIQDNGHRYDPRTFMVEFAKGSNGSKYVIGKTQLAVKNIEKIRRDDI